MHFDPELEPPPLETPPISFETWGGVGEEVEGEDEDDIVEVTEPYQPPDQVENASESSLTMQMVEEEGWGKFYETCPVWGSYWVDTHNPTRQWPVGVKLFKEKLYFSEMLCIPTAIQQPYIRLCHDKMAHVGTGRL